MLLQFFHLRRFAFDGDVGEIINIEVAEHVAIYIENEYGELSLREFLERCSLGHIGQRQAVFTELFYVHISIVSPSLVISQKGILFSSVNSFIRQADSKPLATKCMGTKRPTLNRSIN